MNRVGVLLRHLSSVASGARPSPPVPNANPPSASLPLPAAPSDKPLTIVLDLDQTLLHSVEATPAQTSSRTGVPLSEANLRIDFGFDSRIHVFLRPHAHEFLRFCAQLGEVVLWTAGTAQYANLVIDHLLDPKSEFIRHRLFRDTVTPEKNRADVMAGRYYKDLGRLGRPLDKVLIVENTYQSYIKHPTNGVPVPSFDDQFLHVRHEDSVLRFLAPIVAEISKHEDVRVPIEKLWGGKPIPGMYL
jgi:RNA polymerase II subunit A small phosphatase-like protein